jgi:outer membrane PBP1 activator LpoA protein
VNVFSNLRIYLSIALSLLFLASCANQTKIVEQKSVDQEMKPRKNVVLNNAEKTLQRAQIEWLKNANINQRNDLLLSAAQDFQTASECTRADIILANIEPFLESPVQQQYSSLLKAECALIQYYESGLPVELIRTPIETMISWLAPITTSQFVARKEVVIAHLAALQQRWDLAANVLSGQLTADSPLNQAQEQMLWQWFLKSSKSTQSTLGRNNLFMRPYLSLATILEDENLTDSSRQQAITFWRQQNPNHPLSVNLPTGVKSYVTQSLREVRNIAVLLPLTGRVQIQGDAIKQGIMSAYFAKLENINTNNPGQVIPNIQFLDTGSDSDRFVSSEITPEGLVKYDIVIGPLLREHVSLVKDFNLPDSMLIYLNRLSTEPAAIESKDPARTLIGSILKEEADSRSNNSLPNLSPSRSLEHSAHGQSSNQALGVSSGNTSAKVYFALAPEDEATQLANLMKKEGIRTPIIISNGSAVSRRMIEAFIAHWTALNGLDEIKRPKVVTFSDNKGLRIGITAALDVLQSQKRISQMSNLTTETVHSVTRNRRDVDAFVVFALPQQVELLNPIIEASISLFTERTIPVFATSYSYQHQLNKNSIRDLRNLVFVDMPFLMPTQRDSQLASQVDNLWNNPPSTFLRLFAFGYDAFQFSEKMQQLAYFSHTDLNGLSGKLSVNDKRQVTRDLPSAVIENDSINQATVF